MILDIIDGTEITLICLVFQTKVERQYFGGAKFALITGKCSIAYLYAAFDSLGRDP
jgi:hypothetical protein